MSSKSTRFVSAGRARAAGRLSRRAAVQPARAACARGTRERAANPTGAQPSSGRAGHGCGGQRNAGERNRGRRSAPAPPAAADSTAPVPDVRHSNTRQALSLMKSGRNSDAELEFKQLALAYPQLRGTAT